MYEVVFFKTESGAVPAQEFLDNLPIKLREKTLRGLCCFRSSAPSFVGRKRSTFETVCSS